MKNQEQKNMNKNMNKNMEESLENEISGGEAPESKTQQSKTEQE